MRDDERLKDAKYIGDGLYADYDGFSFELIAPREYENHSVVLEPAVLQEFLGFVSKKLGLTITIQRPDRDPVVIDKRDLLPDEEC